MANKYLDTAFLDRAIEFAVKAHSNSERRGKGFPYIVHPLEAMEIVSTMTPDQELLAAAVLHDTIEDTGVTVEDLRREFGERVANLVEAESDKFVEGLSESASWHDRKQAAIDRINAAPYEAKMVALGDKLSNMRAIWRDYKKQGDDLWKIFHVTDRKSHEWHYRGLAHSLSELSDTFAYREFTRLIDSVFGQETTPELIDMADYEQSGDGYTAVSYFHKDGKKMMKLYAEFIPIDVPIRELQISRDIEFLGFRIPRALRLVTDGKKTGTEFERIVNKRSFARAISQEPENLPYYAEKFARLCKTLHSTKCNELRFSDSKERYLATVAAAKNFDDAQKARMTEFINNTPDTGTCLHGDLHIGNIVTNGKEDFWIDLADFGYGNPLFDLGTFYYVMTQIPEELVQNLFHISKAQTAECWRIFAGEYFGDDYKGEETDLLVAPYAALTALYFGERDVLYPEMRAYIEKYLL